MRSSVDRETALELEDIERRAWRDAHAAASAAERDALGLRPRELAGGFVLAADREDSLLQNRALGLGLREPITGSVVDTLREHFQGNRHGFALNLCPFAEPAGVEGLLVSRGFATYFHHLKWVRGQEPLAPVRDGPRVERIGNERAGEWAALHAEVHPAALAHATWNARIVGRPGWSHYLAYQDAVPIAVAAMFVADGLAWLGFASTRTQHRRQGAQGALLAQRVRDGLEQGVRWFTLETGPAWPDLPGDSLRNAARAGFRPAYQRPSWITGHS